MSQFQSTETPQIKKETPTAIAAVSIVCGAAVASAGYLFLSQKAGYHWFWAASAGVLGSAGIFRSAYDIVSTIVQTRRFSSNMLRNTEGSLLAEDYVRKLGLHPREDASEIGANVAMLFIVPFIVTGLYELPWHPKTTGLMITRVIVVILGSFLVAIGVSRVLDAGATRRLQRVTDFLKGLAPDSLHAFRLALRKIRRDQDRVAMFFFSLQLGDSFTSSQKRKLAWQAAICLACAEKEKVARRVKQLYMITIDRGLEAAWPALAEQAIRKIQEAGSTEEAGNQVPASLSAEIVRRCRIVQSITPEAAKSLPGYREVEYQVTGGSPLMPARILVIEEWALMTSSATLADMDELVNQLPDRDWLFIGTQEESDEWGKLSAK